MTCESSFNSCVNIYLYTVYTDLTIYVHFIINCIYFDLDMQWDIIFVSNDIFFNQLTASMAKVELAIHAYHLLNSILSPKRT